MVKELVCIFNRKSRSDGDTDTTLSNHRSITTKLCDRMDVRYTDDSIYEEILSGATKFEERTELLRMLRDIESGLYHAVVVVELQRLARSGHLSQLIADTLEKANCLIITPTQTYDLRNKEHRLMYDMVSSLGVYELKTTDNRMRDGYTEKAKAGHYVSAQAPYGYDAVWDDLIKRKFRTLVPNDKAEYAQLMFQLADEGYSLREIAHELNQRGISTINGKEWYIRTIQHILNNKAYTGTLIVQLKDKYTKKPSEIIETPDAFPALITEEQYDRVQLAVKSRLSGDMETRTRSRGQVKTILKDLVFCNVCGRKIGFTSSAKRPDALVVKKCECGNKGVMEPTLRELFYEQLEFVESYWREEWNKVLNVTPANTTSDLEGKINDLVAQKGKYATRSKNSREAFLDRDITREEYLSDKADAESKIADLDKSIAEVKSQMSQLDVDSICTQMKDRFTILEKVRNSKDTKEVNRLLKLIIERVHYQRGDGGIESDVITLMIAPK
jgi:site-specific DNA recombinase